MESRAYIKARKEGELYGVMEEVYNDWLNENDLFE